MRITESKLRSIIRSVIRESLEGDMKISSMSREAFNKMYGDIMLKTGDEHHNITKEYTNNHDHYDDFEYGLTIVGKPYAKRKIAEALESIDCKTPSESEYHDYVTSREREGEQWERSWQNEWYKKWLENNASEIIECLNNADVETRRMFFSQIDNAVYH